MKKNKIKFWIPIFGGFTAIPGEENYLSFRPVLFSIFLAYHIFWVLLPFIVL
jgi:hypothetical protein